MTTSQSTRPKALSLHEATVLEPIETPDRRFQQVLQEVRESDYLPQMEHHLVAPTGRPRYLSWFAWAVLMMLTAESQSSFFHLTQPVRVAAGLTPTQRDALGLTLKRVAYHHIEGGVHDLAAALKETVDPTTGEIFPPRLPLTPAVLTTMITTSTLPAVFREATDDAALDSTDLECSARRRGQRGAPDPVDRDPDLPTSRRPPREPLGPDGRHQPTIDPDAREGYRSGKGGRPKEVFIGWDAHTVCLVAPQGARVHLPAVIIGFSLEPAGSSKATAGLQAIDAARHFSPGIRHVLADRGYTYLKAESWAKPLAARGITQTIDLHTNQYGTHPGPRPGTIYIDGTLFSDAVPKNLRRLPRLGPGSARDLEIQALYQRRAPFAFVPKGPIRPGSHKQLMHGPARAKHIRCPNYPPSMKLPEDRYRTTTCQPGACHCGSVIVVQPDERLRERQPRLFGTPAWFQDYGRRSHIESSNADLKHHTLGLVQKPFRVRGTTKTAILFAFLLATSNRRRANRYLSQHPAPGSRDTHPAVHNSYLAPTGPEPHRRPRATGPPKRGPGRPRKHTPEPSPIEPTNTDLPTHWVPIASTPPQA